MEQTATMTFRKDDCSIKAKNIFCDPSEFAMAALTPTTVIQMVANNLEKGGMSGDGRIERCKAIEDLPCMP